MVRIVPRVAFYTLGCKLNQYETEAMRSQFEKGGYRSVEFHQDADVYVINTCTVTNRSDVRSRQMIRRAARRGGKPLVVVTGCYAQRAPRQLYEIPGVDLVLGNLEKARVLEYVERQGERGAFVSPLEGSEEFPKMEVSDFARHTRAFLKIQDGCDGHCTYCVVPAARGRSRSQKFDSVVAQVKGFIQADYREIVLTGVNLGRYRDPQRPELDFLALLKWLERRSDLGRVRLSSIEPGDFTEELIDFLSHSKKICRHLHIPMQSGSDEILQAMGRPYTVGDYARLVQKLAEVIPGVALGADVIVGFPGETPKQFQATRRLLEDLPICRFHVFSFSQRAGTPAATMSHQVPPEVRQERSRVLRALSEAKFKTFQSSFLKHHLIVLVEQRRDSLTGLLTGLSDNYIRILARGSDQQMNKLIPLKIYRVDQERVWGRLVCAGEDG
jgi:threonylcarbamoyladenosine tRNA methylthiotransferase MtaB